MLLSGHDILLRMCMKDLQMDRGSSIDTRQRVGR